MSVAHGGRLRQAIAQYGGAANEWFDLSTAIAPWPYPLPQPPATVWQRLPEPDDGVNEAIQHYYGAEGLPIPGSQAALQWLPVLFPHLQHILIPAPSYGEYSAVCLGAGRTVVTVPLTEEAIDTALAKCDGLILGQPNNPTGHCWSLATLRHWHAHLAARGGLLVIDEAFADASAIADGTPSPLPAWATQTPGVIVLRSLGKFFGLAGCRFGVLFAEKPLRERFAAALGPWAVSHPARWAAVQALTDRSWQQEQLARMSSAANALVAALHHSGWLAVPPSDLLTTSASERRSGPLLPPWSLFPYAFTVPCAHPAAAANHLAQQQVLVRPLPQEKALRFGLVACEALPILSRRLTAAQQAFANEECFLPELCP